VTGCGSCGVGEPDLLPKLAVRGPVPRRVGQHVHQGACALDVVAAHVRAVGLQQVEQGGWRHRRCQAEPAELTKVEKALVVRIGRARNDDASHVRQATSEGGVDELS